AAGARAVFEEAAGAAPADLAKGLAGKGPGPARGRDVLVEPLDGGGELLVDRLERRGELGGHAGGDDPARRQPFEGRLVSHAPTLLDAPGEQQPHFGVASTTRAARHTEIERARHDAADSGLDPH